VDRGTKEGQGDRGTEGQGDRGTEGQGTRDKGQGTRDKEAILVDV